MSLAAKSTVECSRLWRLFIDNRHKLEFFCKLSHSLGSRVPPLVITNSCLDNHNIQPLSKITIRCQSPGGNPMQHLHLRHHQPVRPHLEDLPARCLRDAGHALRKPHRGSALSPLWLLHHLCRLGVLCHLWSCLCCSGVEGDSCSRS